MASFFQLEHSCWTREAKAIAGSSECEQIANIVCDEMSLENIEYYFTGSVDARRMERRRQDHAASRGKA